VCWAAVAVPPLLALSSLPPHDALPLPGGALLLLGAFVIPEVDVVARRLSLPSLVISRIQQTIQ
jgi:hypothetical protein